VCFCCVFFGEGFRVLGFGGWELDPFGVVLFVCVLCQRV